MSKAPRRGYAIVVFSIASIAAFSTYYSCWGNDTEQRFNKGLEYLYENHYEDAESHFLIFAREMARSDDPDAAKWQAKALFRIGRIDHLYLDQPHRAVSQIRKALKLYPNAPFAFDARKEIADILYDRIMDYRTSALEYERLVHDFSDHEGIDAYQYRVAQSYFLVRDFDQARTEARMLLNKWPEGRFAQEARLLIANSYYLQNRLTEAIKAHRELLDSNPDIPIRARSLFELGICYQDLGEKKKAEEAFIAALKDHPRPDLVQMQLAALRERIKNEDQATKPLAYPTEPAVSDREEKPVRHKKIKPSVPTESKRDEKKPEKSAESSAGKSIKEPGKEKSAQAKKAKDKASSPDKVKAENKPSVKKSGAPSDINAPKKQQQHAPKSEKTNPGPASATKNESEAKKEKP